MDEAYGQAPTGDGAQLFDVKHCTTAGAAHGIGGTNDDWVAKLVSNLFCLFYAEGQLAFWHLDTQAVHCFFEDTPVLASLNSIHLNTNYFDSILLKHAGASKFGGQIKSALAPKIGQQGVGTLVLNDFCHTLQIKRLDIGYVSGAGVGHNRCRVGIGQHYLVAQLAKCLAGLSARVVELAGLANDDRAGADYHNFFNILSFWHILNP